MAELSTDELSNILKNAQLSLLEKDSAIPIATTVTPSPTTESDFSSHIQSTETENLPTCLGNYVGHVWKIVEIDTLPVFADAGGLFEVKLQCNLCGVIGYGQLEIRHFREQGYQPIH